MNWAYTVPISSPSVAVSAFTHLQNFALNASVIDGKIGFGISPKPSSFDVIGTYRGDQKTFTQNVALFQAVSLVAWLTDGYRLQLNSLEGYLLRRLKKCNPLIG